MTALPRHLRVSLAVMTYFRGGAGAPASTKTSRECSRRWWSAFETKTPPPRGWVTTNEVVKCLPTSNLLQKATNNVATSSDHNQESPSSSRTRRKISSTSSSAPTATRTGLHIRPCTQRTTSVSSMDTTGSNPKTVAQRMGRAEERREGSMGPHHEDAKKATTAGGGGTAPASGLGGDAEGEIE